MSTSQTVADLLRLFEAMRQIDQRASGGWLRTEDEIHEQLLEVQRERFRTQGASEGSRWADQEPGWARLKERLGIKPVPMRWIGGKERLFPSMTQKNHRDHFYRVTGLGIEFGTRLDYAARLDRGGEKNPLGEIIPARDLNEVGDESRAILAKRIAHFIATGGAK